MSKLKKKEPDTTTPDLSAEVTPEVANLLKEIPKEKRQLLYRAISLSIRQHNGPLPDGETIAIYNQNIPNGGDRLMTNVEKQLDHRIKIETEAIKRSFNQSSTGQWMAFIIALIFGIIAWDLAKSGHDEVGAIIGGIDIVGLVTAFIYGKMQQQK